MASVAISEQQPEQSQNASPQEIAPVHKEQDEIKKFVNAPSITASESYWRICSFDVHGREPSLQRLKLKMVWHGLSSIRLTLMQGI